MKKYDNFCRALKNLEEGYQYEEPYSNVVLTGLVALYEICFEQAWKAMKEIMEQDGIREAATGSPKSIIKAAYSAGLVEDEELWLSALSSRNNVAHAYNEAIAYDIVEQTREHYIKMFENLKVKIEQEWN